MLYNKDRKRSSPDGCFRLVMKNNRAVLQTLGGYFFLLKKEDALIINAAKATKNMPICVRSPRVMYSIWQHLLSAGYCQSEANRPFTSCGLLVFYSNRNFPVCQCTGDFLRSLDKSGEKVYNKDRKRSGSDGCFRLVRKITAQLSAWGGYFFLLKKK